MSILKHVGRVKATGKKCIVAYNTLPGDAYNCLIVPTESLPDEYHNSIINLVESNAGQAADEFAEVMARNTFPDGSIILAALHTQGRLIKASTDQIEMLPTPAYAILLSEINQARAESRGVTVDDLSIKSSVLADGTPSATIAKPEDDPNALSPELQAKKYRSDADRLSKEAAQLRRLADELVPPAKKAKTETVEAVTTAPKVDENISSSTAVKSEKVESTKTAS